MALYEDLQVVIDDVIAAYKDAQKDGKLTFSEVLTLVYRAGSSLVHAVATVGKGTREEQKVVVATALAKFFDVVITPINIKSIPDIIEPVVDSGIKSLVLTLASSWIDTMFLVFDKMGWNVPESDGPAKMTGPLIF
jgi:hypothetical protein